MTSFLPGEIILVNEPFTTGSALKLRPGVVLFDVGDDDVVVARITRRKPSHPYDIPIIRWQEAGLLAPSTVRLHKLLTSEKALVGKRVGQMAPEDLDAIRRMLRLLFSGWLTVAV
jgi:mRNA interferase MazF